MDKRGNRRTIQQVDQTAKKNLRKRTCKQCGNPFLGGPRAWYCPKCRNERQRERERQYKKHGPTRQIGDIDKCQICGKEYIIQGGLQKYCNECAEIQRKELDRKQGLEYYHTNKEKINTQRKALNIKPDLYVKICTRCKSEFETLNAWQKVCDNCKEKGPKAP